MKESASFAVIEIYGHGLKVRKSSERAYHQKLYGDIKAPEHLGLGVKNAVTKDVPQESVPKVDVPTP